MAAALIPFPQVLQPPLPTVEGNVDYRKLREELLRIDQLLMQSGIELEFISLCLEQWLAASDQTPPARAQLKYQIHTRRALRCNILRTYLNEDFRGLAARLADSPLFQYFCGLAEMDKVMIPAKSTLQRYAHWAPDQMLQPLLDQLLRQAHEDPKAVQLKQPVDLDSAFLDTTCVKANIHYPTDWVLFRDSCRTLLKAIELIRDQGLRHRMPEPAVLLRAMNCLCIEMAHVPRKTDSQRHRKKVLRKMDKQLACAARHAKRYRQLLDEQWQKTQWTRAQAAQVLGRMDNVLQQLPAVRKQARQRILQEQPVANEDKILSLYEPAVNVVVRRKAGVEVEFGNTLLLAESAQGLILDFALFEKSAPADSRMIKPCVQRIEQNLQIKLKHVIADRGFDSAANEEQLRKSKTYNGIAPRNPRALKKRKRSWKFVKLQRRRSQIEGRISIVVHNFLGSPMRCKGFEHRRLAVGWGVLTHNLWVLARLPKRKVTTKAAPARRQAA
jgi:IS5 family transposase